MTLFGIVLNRRNAVKVSWYCALAFFSYLMLLITMQYIPIRLDAAFLNTKTEEVKSCTYRLAFFTHVFTSIFVLLTGVSQFSDSFRKRFSSLHRLMGKVYVFLILFFAAPSGLIMACVANGGIPAQISFFILAVLWVVFTLVAFIFVRKKNWEKHSDFMYRSYALTLSAISLRLLKWFIVLAFGLAPITTYILVAWLGWLINLALAEILIRYKKRLKAIVSTR